jgi:hypothetical protein
MICDKVFDVRAVKRSAAEETMRGKQAMTKRIAKETCDEAIDLVDVLHQGLEGLHIQNRRSDA